MAYTVEKDLHTGPRGDAQSEKHPYFDLYQENGEARTKILGVYYGQKRHMDDFFPALFTERMYVDL